MKLKRTKQILRLSLFAVTAFTSFVALAATAPVSSGMPPAKRAGQITYFSGGGTPAQVNAMDTQANRYPLELLFLWGRGEKETPVDVAWSIKNAAGRELVDASASGPEVLASLPDGRYTVVARYDETTLSRTVLVHRGKHDTVVLEWPS